MNSGRITLSLGNRLEVVPPLVEALIRMGGSDLHVAADDKPFVRVNGELCNIPDCGVLSASDVKNLAMALLGEVRYIRFMKEHECDYAVSLPGGERLRVNASLQHRRVALAIRYLPAKMIPLESIGLSRRIISHVCSLRHGLVLVTGATGSGKTTTLASFINEFNLTRSSHIVTIEEPIEYIHKSRGCFVTQREVGVDTESFSEALRRSFRQDPDIVLIGEMRDEETIRAALTLSETGHLTFGTLHTSEAYQTVMRIIGSFPPSEQERVRMAVAASLRVVICQQLIPRSDGNGRVMAAETLVVNPAVRALIRDSKLHQIPSVIKSGSSLGMSTMNQSLAKIVRQHIVSQDEACSFSPDREDLLEELLYRQES